MRRKDAIKTKPYTLEDTCWLSLTPEDFVRINVCGHTYEVLKTTLSRFPGTLLGNEDQRQQYYVDFLDACYFDHKREVFESILYYYQSNGSLVRPCNIPMDLYAQMVRFYGIPEKDLRGMQILEGYSGLKDLNEDEEEDVLPENTLQRKVWLLMEYPESSVFARIIGLFSILVILLSITTFCLDTVPRYHHHGDDQQNSTRAASIASKPDDVPIVVKMIQMVEYISTAYFALEYFVRFLAAPKKWTFFKSFLNLIDLCAVLPYFIILIVESRSSSSFGVLRVARLVRVFRVFKLSRHSLGLQVLGDTLWASFSELSMVLFMLCFSVIIFSSAIYFAEHENDALQPEAKEQFKSIPDAFWYTLVTMTTVGYGDYFPLSFPGKLVGAFCAINGVLVLAMVVPIIVTNFDFFYKRDKMITARKTEKRLKGVTMEQPDPQERSESNGTTYGVDECK